MKETDCSCNACKKMCTHSPCIGTLEEMVKIAYALGTDDLIPTSILDPVTHQMKDIIALRGTPWKPDPNMQYNAMKCCMQDEQGLCKLHKLNLKPSEGRLIHHTTTQEENFQIRHDLLETWTKYNQ